MNGNESVRETTSHVSRLDQASLLASLVITETAGVTTSDGSKARYIMLGVAALAFIKGIAGFMSAESTQNLSEPDPEVL